MRRNSKSLRDLMTLHIGDGASERLSGQERLDAALRRMDRALSWKDPLATQEESNRLKGMFQRCCNGGLIHIPDVFAQTAQYDPYAEWGLVGGELINYSQFNVTPNMDQSHPEGYFSFGDLARGVINELSIGFRLKDDEHFLAP